MVSKATRDARANQFAELRQKLLDWEIPDEAIDTVYDAARVSLDEVKGLTEYEDGKVSRAAFSRRCRTSSNSATSATSRANDRFMGRAPVIRGTTESRA